MSDPNSTSNVKIYDRPEKKGPSPIALVLALLIVLVIAFGIYRAMSASKGSSTPTENTRTTSGAKSAANP